MPFKKPTRRTGMTHFPLQDERMSQREVPQEGRRKRMLLQRRDQTREDIACRERREEQAPSLQRMILKAAEERAGIPAARVQGYWPVGRVQKEISQLSVMF